MSLDCLACGRLVKPSERRTAKNGRPFTVAQMTATSDGDESILVSLIAFRSEAVAGLAALGAGDACAVAGRAKVTTWPGRDGETKAGLSIVVEQVLTTYHVRRRRQAVQGDEGGGDDRTSDPPTDRFAAGRDSRRSGSTVPRRPAKSIGGIADMPDDDPFGE